MKQLAALLLLTLAAASAPGAPEGERRHLPGPLRALGPVEVENARSVGNRFAAGAWRRVKTYDMQALQRVDPLPLRQVVGVRFNYRHERISHWKPNWYQSSIWRYRREAQDEFDYIQVLVAKADLEAFKAIPSQVQAGREFVVYGQVLKDFDANFVFLRLIGTKVKRERGGRVTVTW